MKSRFGVVIKLLVGFGSAVGCRSLIGATPLELSSEAGGSSAQAGVSGAATTNGGTSSALGSGGSGATNTTTGGSAQNAGASGMSESAGSAGDTNGAPLSSATNAIAIAGFAEHIVALGPGNAVYSWGYNPGDLLKQPALNGGKTALPGMVTRIDGSGPFVAESVSGVGDAACALAAGAVYCWGSGTDVLGQSTGPGGAPVSGVSNVVEIAMGVSFACARTQAAELYCWGDNRATHPFDQLTASFDDTQRYTTATGYHVRALDGLQHVALGGDHGCAISPTGDALCWGRDDTLQTGQPPDACISAFDASFSNPCTKTPSRVAGLSDVRQLALGFTHSCALDGLGRVFCWGSNGSGELGGPSDGESTCTNTMDSESPSTTVPCTADPVQVAGLGSASFIAVGTSAEAGINASCAVVAGEVLCWGSSPDHVTMNVNGDPLFVPQRIYLPSGDPLGGVVSMAIGSGYACARTNDISGGLYCWGANPVSGDYSVAARPVPW